MKKKMVLVALAVLLLAGVAGTAFAQRTQKIGEAEFKALSARIKNSNMDYGDVKTALTVLEYYLKWTPNKSGSWGPNVIPDRSAQKSLMDILDPDLGIVSTLGTLKDLYDLCWDYAWYQKGESVTKGSNLAFNTLFFVSGFTPIAPYLRASIEVARKGAAILKKQSARSRWTWIVGDPLTELGLHNQVFLTEVTSFQGSGSTQMYFGWALNPNYAALAENWFCIVWDPKMTRLQEGGILRDISHYITALEVLKKAGF